MEVLRNWLLPGLLAAGQAAVLAGAALWRGPVDRVEVAAALAATALAAAALGWRRRAPVAALAGVAAALTLGQLATPVDTLLVIVFADVMALYSVGARRPARITLAATAGLIGWQAALGIAMFGTGREYAGNLVISIVVYLLTAGLGRSRRRWRAARREAADRLARAEADRRQASVVERQRLARELHDVSAHHLTSIVVTVTAAQRLAGRRPELAAEALEFAARTGRETQSALHRLVAVMRGVELEGGSALGRRVEELAAGFAALGQPVTVRLSLDSDDCAVSEAAYGIVREALTNALRHAPGAAVEVRLGHRDGALQVAVENAIAAAPAATGGLGSGNGLPGMRERAAATGGTLDAGPRPGGGWRVRAVLPAAAASTVDHSPFPARRRVPLRAVATHDGAGPGFRFGLPLLADVALVLAVVALPVSLVLLPDPQVPRLDPAPGALTTMLLAAHALPLLWRRHAPWRALAGVLATTGLWPLVVGYALLAHPAIDALGCGIVAEFMAVYAVAAYGRPRHLTWLSAPLAAAVLAAAMVTAAAADGSLLDLPAGSPVTVAVTAPVTLALTLVLGAVWGAGFAVRARRDRVTSRERTAVAASTAGAVEMASAERARIAAGLRAAVLRHAGRVTVAAEEGRLDGVLDAARAALAAMRDLLGGLRGDAARAPQPTAAAIYALCRQQRASGRAVELHSPAEPRTLPPAVDVSAYRVVETALAAGDAGPARVTLGYGPDDLRITVTGVPSATAGPVAAGLHARIAALGGRMTIDSTGTMDVWLPALS